MPTPAGPALRKTTLNLFAEDIPRLEFHYGHGWSEVIREMVHAHIQSCDAMKLKPRKTLGDLSND